ncbi:MAG: ABC transporter permease [Tannerellaceae bacterium]|nr:ABC transporter permease [Tannerellaceae bacterium]
MYKQLLKQAWYTFLESPYQGCITILGTGLSVSLIVSLLMGGFWGKMMNISPENHRTRTLYVKWVGVENKETGLGVEDGFLSLQTIRECFQSLETPEEVVVTSPLQAQIASVPGRKQTRCLVSFTDDAFWRIFDFSFLAGSPYDKADFEAGMRKVVLSEDMARSLFGDIKDLVGKQVLLNYHMYTISAIVKNVNPYLSHSYGEAWIPYTSTHIREATGTEGITGRYKCQILARSHWDMGKIRREVEAKVQQYNNSLADHRINLYRQPDIKVVEEDRFGPRYPDMRESVISNAIMILVILLVPAINLSGFTLSRMRERKEEFGVRKAFGGTRITVFWQVIWENMVYSIMGGLLAILFYWVTTFFLKDMVFISGSQWGLDVTPEVPAELIFNPVVFLLAFLFCLIINLLSAGLPAWKISSLTVIDSFKAD